MADVRLLSDLPVDRRWEAARRQVAALAKERTPSKRVRRLIDAELLAGDRARRAVTPPGDRGVAR